MDFLFLLIFRDLFDGLTDRIYNVASLISFVLFLLFSVGVYRLLFDRNIKKIVGLFVFYSLIAITLYLLQYATVPEYKGFSGPPGGVGTDEYIWKNNEPAMRTVAVTFVILLLILSQLSLQSRHKTMIMPLFYILVAYGFYNKTKFSEILGIGGFLSLIFVQFAVNIIRIVE